jgi:molybdopterin/thiamine biosynthesis adenylyltransferase
MLTKNELNRYNRQLLLAELGEERQAKLKSARVVIAGIGGLGCSSSVQLACAGVGHITIIDNGLVELSNLNRQFLYCEEDIGEKKTAIANRKLAKLNPTIQINPIFTK